MGRDVTLYPKKASRKELRDHLEGLGFVRCGHFWNWPAGTLNYSWFNDEDFKSIDGVSADIYPVSEDKRHLTNNEWALHVRNVYSASWHDVEMLTGCLRRFEKNLGERLRGTMARTVTLLCGVTKAPDQQRNYARISTRQTRDFFGEIRAAGAHF